MPHSPRRSCAQHRRRLARAACTSCGEALCGACLMWRDGVALCPRCSHAAAAEAGGGDDQRAALEPAAAPPAAAAPVVPHGSLRALYALATLQTAATIIAAACAWWTVTHAPEVASDPAVERAGTARAAASGTALPLAGSPPALAALPIPERPRVALEPGATLRGAPVSILGVAPGAEHVALRVNDRTIAVSLVHDGRFGLDTGALESGEHRLSVVAYASGRTPAASAIIPFRYEAPATAEPPTVRRAPSRVPAGRTPRPAAAPSPLPSDHELTAPSTLLATP